MAQNADPEYCANWYLFYTLVGGFHAKERASAIRSSFNSVRERNNAEVRKVVLIPRARGAETALEVEEVVVGDWGLGCHPRRYVVCFNPEEARRDAVVREAILDSLRTKLQRGERANCIAEYLSEGSQYEQS
jgi:hypothetical protein